MLSILVVNKERDCDRLLEPLLFAYQMTPHSSTGEMPFFLIYGQAVYRIGFLFSS